MSDPSAVVPSETSESSLAEAIAVATPDRVAPLRAHNLPGTVFADTENALENTKIPKAQRDIILHRRNQAIYACVVQFLFGVGCLPLSGVRGKYGKVAAVTNSIVLVCGIIGFDAASRVRMAALFAHFSLVTSLELLFVGFIVISNAARAATADEAPETTGERWVMLAFLLFGVVDLVVAAFTYRLWRALARVRDDAPALRNGAGLIADWRGGSQQTVVGFDAGAATVPPHNAAGVVPAMVPVARPISADTDERLAPAEAVVVVM